MRQKQAAGDRNRGGDGCEPSSTTGRNDSQRAREMQLSIAASASVFPGFRFSPTDDELISFYLKKKLQGCDNCVDIIPEVDFCRHEPWDLPGLSIIRSDNEWFFFSTRGKKYPNGSQSKRATQSGYWKATGKERNVKSGTVTIGTKRTLVFHRGRAPKGERTEWIMHEYCMCDALQEALVVCRLRRNVDFRLNESSRGSSDQMISSAADNYHQFPNNTQINVMDEFNEGNIAVKSCSMESKSSCRSDSGDQQNDSESVSDLHLIPDLPSGYSTPVKINERTIERGTPSEQPLYPNWDRGKEGDTEEDDCFADIINDDIIKLDESGSRSRSLMINGLFTGTKYTEILPPAETMGAPGTTVRRIRVKHQKEDEKASGDHINERSDKRVPGCVFTVLGGSANTLSWFHPAYLVILFLVILLVAWKHNYMMDLKHLGMGMDVPRRHLRYWLRKAADYI